MKNNCKGQHLHFLSVVSLAIYITTFSWPSLSPKHMATYTSATFGLSVLCYFKDNMITLQAGIF